MRCSHYTAMLAVAAAFILNPFAADAQDIQWGPKGKVSEPEKGKDGPLPLIVVADGTPVLAGPEKNSAKVGTAKYGDGYYLGDRAKSGSNDYYLAIRQKDNSAVGWFPSHAVLVEPRAKKEGTSAIYLKAVIVNKWQKNPKGKPELKGAQSLNGPGSRPGGGAPYDELRKLNLFRFYYVFAKVPSEDASGDEYYLLGFKPSITTPSSAKDDTLVGWVSSKTIQDWNTREGVEFDKSTLSKRLEGVPASVKGEKGGGVAVYENEKDLTETLRGEVGLEAVVSEDTTMTSELNYASQRFPLLDSKANGVWDKAGRILEIGYIGDQIYVSGEGSKTARSGDALSQDLNKLNKEVLPKLRAIDIVFVIDSTGSMEPFFESTRKAVLDITSSIEAKMGTDRPRIRYSVQFYRDYTDEAKSYLTKRLPLTENVAEVTNFLSAEKGEGGGDAHEAVFHGIDSALAGSSTEMDEYSFKMLVLIGDAGNHREESRGYTEKDIAKRLRDAGFSFSYILVKNPEELAEEGPVRDFRDQAERIKGMLEEGSNEGLATQDVAKVAESILNFANLHVEVMQKTTKGGREMTTGKGLKQIGSEYGVVVQRKLTDAMVAAGMDPNAFLEQSAQVFGTGYTTEKNRTGIPQCRVMMLLEKNTLEQLAGLLAGFIVKPANKETVGELWKNTLKSAIGELDESKPIAELIQNHLGVPVKLGVLQKTLEQVSKMPDEELKAQWEELDKAKQRISAIISEKKIEIVKTEGKTEGRGYKVLDKGTRKVWWTNDSVTDYGWLRADELP